MTRTVVAFKRLGDKTIMELADAPIDVPGLGDVEVVEVSALPAGTREAGEELMRRISLHPPVKQALAHTLASPPGSPPSPLYFHVVADQADALPWEQLYADGTGFCALDKRWPIVRIAWRPREVPPHEFAPPLRIVAVLSATGRSGTAQLHSLVEAITSADGQALGARLHVISGEEAVLDEAVQAGDVVTADAIAPNGHELSAQIRQAEPHVLHVFCHGGITAGESTLSFGSVADMDGQAAEGSITVGVTTLSNELLQVAPWMIVLNACATADTGGPDRTEGGALAHELAAAGVPAVVGMRRLVDMLTADLFAETFYPELLKIIRSAVGDAGPAETRDIGWAAALFSSRGALSGADADLQDAWTDPVLYVQRGPFQITMASPERGLGGMSQLMGQLDVYERFLDSLDPAVVAPDVIEDVAARIAELRGQIADAQGS